MSIRAHTSNASRWRRMAHHLLRWPPTCAARTRDQCEQASCGMLDGTGCRPAAAFTGVGKPEDPDNVSISAADGAMRFAFVGDYRDSFPQEDLDLASQDRFYMADVSGVRYDSVNVALGIGNATAISGAFIAGFDGDVKLVRSRYHDLVAIVWHCAFNERANGRTCARSALGPGIAYGINSYGVAVGDNRVVGARRGIVAAS